MDQLTFPKTHFALSREMYDRGFLLIAKEIGNELNFLANNIPLCGRVLNISVASTKGT